MKKFIRRSLVVLFIIAAVIFVFNMSFVWVSTNFTGGVQCAEYVPRLAGKISSDSPENKPPDPSAIFRENNISVLFEEVEHLPVCEACGCPNYAFIQYFLIYKLDLENAKALGFEKTEMFRRWWNLARMWLKYV